MATTHRDRELTDAADGCTDCVTQLGAAEAIAVRVAREETYRDGTVPGGSEGGPTTAGTARRPCLTASESEPFWFEARPGQIKAAFQTHSADGGSVSSRAHSGSHPPRSAGTGMRQSTDNAQTHGAMDDASLSSIHGTIRHLMTSFERIDKMQYF